MGFDGTVFTELVSWLSSVRYLDSELPVEVPLISKQERG